MQVKKLFEDVNYEPGAREVYIAAWDLRQLYTFAFRRQNDATKRNQRPRDCSGQRYSCFLLPACSLFFTCSLPTWYMHVCFHQLLQDKKVKALFEKIRDLRTQWAKWAIEDVQHAFDPSKTPSRLESDCFEAASPAPSPDPTLKSGNVPQYREKRSASSLASEVTPKASDEPTMVGSPGESQLQLDVLGEACSVPMTAEQQKELDSVLHQLHMMRLASRSREFCAQVLL